MNSRCGGLGRANSSFPGFQGPGFQFLCFLNEEGGKARGPSWGEKGLAANPFNPGPVGPIPGELPLGRFPAWGPELAPKPGLLRGEFGASGVPHIRPGATPGFGGRLRKRTFLNPAGIKVWPRVFPPGVVGRVALFGSESLGDPGGFSGLSPKFSGPPGGQN